MANRINYLVSVEIDAPDEVDDNPKFDEMVVEFTDACVDLAKEMFADFPGVKFKGEF